jgi:RNA polymerase sigma-70 factor (ECF subfamily)
MPGAASQDVLRHLNTLFHRGTAGQLGDPELLERFVASGDEDAFTALVERHGAMVLGVCRRVLAKHDGAEDAFQATFLVLARKAAGLAQRDHLASWLYGVAHRAALDARARALRRRANERRLTPMQFAEPHDSFDSNELRGILDEELSRLSDRHRLAIVLCELEGLSRRDAALRLGISEGTLSSRLARAKARLKDRLTRRGLALSTIALASALAHEARAVVVPPTLIDSTTQAAAAMVAGSPLAGVVSTSVTTLAEGVLKTMLIAKMKSVALSFAALALVGTGVIATAQSGPDNVRPADDRLKAVEQKLDKLLEVLGGKGNHVRLYPPAAAIAQLPPQPGATPAPPALPLPVAPVAATPSLLVPPAAPQPPYAVSPNAVPPPHVSRAPGSHATPSGLLGRIETLEHRFAELERRLSALERSTRQSRFRSAPPSAAPIGHPVAETAPAPLPSPVPRNEPPSSPGPASDTAPASENAPDNNVPDAVNDVSAPAPASEAPATLPADDNTPSDAPSDSSPQRALAIRDQSPRATSPGPFIE